MRRKWIEHEATLRMRIRQLEHIICPGEQHELCKAGEEMHIIDGQGTTIYTRRYVCKRCGKITEREEMV